MAVLYNNHVHRNCATSRKFSCNQGVMSKLGVLLVIFFTWDVSARPLDGFNCPVLPPLTQSARNVRELRPQDIKVVMALGDSVTAGCGKFACQ